MSAKEVTTNYISYRPLSAVTIITVTIMDITTHEFWVLLFLLRFGRSSLRLTGPDFVHQFSPRKAALEDKMICGI